MSTRGLHVAVLVVSLSAVAHAGSVEVYDPGHYLSPRARGALHAHAERWPFKVKVLVAADGTTQAFAAQAQDLMDGSRLVVVALAPPTHTFRIDVGYSIGAHEDRAGIAAAGDVQFRAGDFLGGIFRIGDLAGKRMDEAAQRAGRDAFRAELHRAHAWGVWRPYLGLCGFLGLGALFGVLLYKLATRRGRRRFLGPVTPPAWPLVDPKTPRPTYVPPPRPAPPPIPAYAARRVGKGDATVER